MKTRKMNALYTPFTPWLCLLLLLALMLPLAAACTQGAPSSADTTPESLQTSGELPTEPSTPPVTEAATDAPLTGTEPATDAITEPVTDTPTPPPTEDLSIPEGATYVFDAQALKAASRVSASSVLHTEEDGLPYVTFRARNEGLINLVSGKAFTAGRYVRIMYRAGQKSAPGQLLIGDNACSALPYQADDQWHMMTVDLYDLQCYSPIISRLGFHPGVDETGDMKQVDIAWVAIYADDGAPYDESTHLAHLPALTAGVKAPSSALSTEDSSVQYMPAGTYTDKSGTYVFKENFHLDIYKEDAYFNRYTLSYSSTSPLRGEIAYVTWGADGKECPHTEVFFLEAGQDMTFSCLIDGYLSSEYAFRISGIDLRTCDGSMTTFSLHSLNTQVARVYATGEFYLENDRYRLGVLLSWGGGISYIEDKLDGDEQISNLINRADTGRLVQQSYYGVGNGPHYTAATYNGTMWNYNPVQGGDQHNNASKLVDVQVSEDGSSIYIKCRPMDWAQNNSLTPSYMENVYTLCEDAIHVSNRFVDFFGVRHGARHAELPAFYTISYLGVFHYYNGTKPWTGDAYETLPDEPFWAGRGSAYHNIVPGNTETWAAWTSPQGYGIGLYVPGTEILLAGRHAYNGSKNPADGGTSYVAPLRTMEFFSFVPFSYEYVISTGTVEEMRAVFATYAEQMG